jgi:hypothetical protein
MKKTILSAMFLMTGIACFAQKSGIIFGVTDGHLGKHTGYQWIGEGVSPETKWTPGIGFNLGYQFNFRLSDRFSLDASVLGKAVQGQINSLDIDGDKVKPWTDKGWIWGASLNGTINYRIYSGLYAGLGIEPTYYLKTDKLKGNSNKQVIDFPLVFALGYEFNNGMKLSASYKHGFKSLYENYYTNNPKSNRELGVSLFIPIFKH